MTEYCIKPTSKASKSKCLVLLQANGHHALTSPLNECRFSVDNKPMVIFQSLWHIITKRFNGASDITAIKRAHSLIKQCPLLFISLP